MLLTTVLLSGDQDGDPIDIWVSSGKGGEVVKAMKYIFSKQVTTQQKLEAKGMPQTSELAEQTYWVIKEQLAPKGRGETNRKVVLQRNNEISSLTVGKMRER